MSIADEWPSFAEELGRKLTQELEKWSEEYAKGRITTKEFRNLVSTLYDATSGLADREVSDLLAAVHKDLMNEAG